MQKIEGRQNSLFNLSQASDQPLQQESNHLSEQLHTTSRKFVDSLDWSDTKTRRLMAKHYRKLTKLLQKPREFNLSQDSSTIEQVVKYAVNLAPYAPYEPSMSNFTSFLVANSQAYQQKLMGRRRCSIPIIHIDNELIKLDSGFESILYKDREFTLHIEGEPQTYIQFTKNHDEHPMLSSHRQIQVEHTTQVLIPPCQLNIVVTQEPFKIESHLVKLKIKLNEKSVNKMHDDHERGLMIRPDVSQLFDESNSSYLPNETFLDIDNSQLSDNRILMRGTSKDR